MYEVLFTKAAQKDFKIILKSPYKKAVFELLDTLEKEPYKKPYEQLVGNLKDFYSRRINIQHRLVYKVDEEHKQIIIVSIWGHYENN